MAHTDTHTNDGLIPLIVAVTGHRDPCPEAVPTLRRSVEGALADEALGENMAWHVLHRERPIEVEAG